MCLNSDGLDKKLEEQKNRTATAGPGNGSGARQTISIAFCTVLYFKWLIF